MSMEPKACGEADDGTAVVSVVSVGATRREGKAEALHAEGDIP